MTHYSTNHLTTQQLRALGSEDEESMYQTEYFIRGIQGTGRMVVSDGFLDHIYGPRGDRATHTRITEAREDDVASSEPNSLVDFIMSGEIQLGEDLYVPYHTFRAAYVNYATNVCGIAGNVSLSPANLHSVLPRFNVKRKKARLPYPRVQGTPKRNGHFLCGLDLTANCH
jgi:hypothetical protein